jgi:hypothetical protein
LTRTPALAGAVAILAAAAAGCGGGSSATPKEDPGRVMKTVIQHELAGDRAVTYTMLVSQQRKVVSKRLYTKCSPGAAMGDADATVGITGVHDEQATVPALGKTKTKAVGYRIDFHNGTDPVISTGHLIAQDGHWRWTLSAAGFDSLSGGNCP